MRTVRPPPLPLPLLLAVGLAACAPVREDQTGDGSGGGDRLQSAYVATDPWTGSEYSLAYVYLVDTDHSCNQILNNYGLAWWNMSGDVTWVMANVYKGRDVEWESTFRSQHLWNQSGGFDYSQADFFSGSFGDGGYGDDDDDMPPPPGDGGDPGEEPGADARDQEGSLGVDALGADDELVIRSWGATVRGDVISEQGSWSFDAEYCGDLPGDVVGIGREDGEDSGSDGG